LPARSRLPPAIIAKTLSEVAARKPTGSLDAYDYYLRGLANGLTGQKSQPQPADAIPTDTYLSGTKKVEVDGCVGEVNRVTTAHTDGDSWIYFRDANVLATGDVFRRNYPNLDWGRGGSINGMINAANVLLKAANDNTKIVPGHVQIGRHGRHEVLETPHDGTRTRTWTVGDRLPRQTRCLPGGGSCRGDGGGGS